MVEFQIDTEDREEDLDAIIERVTNSGVRISGMRVPRQATRGEFLSFCERHPKLRAELAPDGTIEIAMPVSTESSRIEGIVYLFLGQWQLESQHGATYPSSAGFTLPSGSVRSPDAAWVSDERLAAIPAEDAGHFARVVPDFVAEVRSASDSIATLREKMSQTWIAAGVRLAWLIDPAEERAYVYRANGSVEVIETFDGALDGEDLLPGFRLELRRMRTNK